MVFVSDLQDYLVNGVMIGRRVVGQDEYLLYKKTVSLCHSELVEELSKAGYTLRPHQLRQAQHDSFQTETLRP
jgi:hypothetical protein